MSNSSQKIMMNEKTYRCDKKYSEHSFDYFGIIFCQVNQIASKDELKILLSNCNGNSKIQSGVMLKSAT